MNSVYYLGTVLACLLIASGARGEYLSSYASHLVEIKTKPNKYEAKPAGNPKYAFVTFITDKRGGVNFQCNPGWVLKNNACEVNPCTGYPYSKQEETQNCKTVDMCQSGDAMKYKCTSCKDGLVSDGKGGCICNTSTYKYNEETNPCMYQYDTSGGTCTHVDSSGKSTVYYKDCLCPTGWSQCLSLLHQIGVGNKCVSGGIDYYASCKCESTYDKTCVEGKPDNPGDYCLNPSDNTRYYRRCYTCDRSKNELYDEEYNNYWCSGWGWIDFEVIRGINVGEGE